MKKSDFQQPKKKIQKNQRLINESKRFFFSHSFGLLSSSLSSSGRSDENDEEKFAKLKKKMIRFFFCRHL